MLHQLNEQDLIDIWQNLPPRIARAFDANDGLTTDEIMQTKEITHSLGDRELLADVEDKLQWMVFKVKQRGRSNYFEKIIDSNTTTDVPEALQGEGLGKSLSKRGVRETDFIAGGAAKGANTLDSEETIGYNWPYDFFSLVELAKIDEDVVFGTPVAVTVDQDFDASTLTKPEGGFLSTKKVSKTVVEQIADQATSGFTQDGVQNSFKTETTKTVVEQIDSSNPNQLVRQGFVEKTESESNTKATIADMPTATPTKTSSFESTNTGTISKEEEVVITEVKSEIPSGTPGGVNKNLKL